MNGRSWKTMVAFLHPQELRCINSYVIAAAVWAMT